MKIVLALLLLAVAASLAAAGVLMLRQRRGDDPQGRRMARALALRVGLSIAAFVLILLGWALGWFQPNALPVGP